MSVLSGSHKLGNINYKNKILIIRIFIDETRKKTYYSFLDFR